MRGFRTQTDSMKLHSREQSHQSTDTHLWVAADLSSWTPGTARKVVPGWAEALRGPCSLAVLVPPTLPVHLGKGRERERLLVTLLFEFLHSITSLTTVAKSPEYRCLLTHNQYMCLYAGMMSDEFVCESGRSSEL